MDNQKQEKSLERIEEISVSCTSGILQHKTQVLTVKLMVPKEYFILPTALAKYGTFPKVEDYLTGKVRTLVSDYLARAEEVVTKASELSKSTKPHK